MTTDTRPKLRVKTVEVNGQTCRIVGMSKGSGMIQPNMATMLGFIATDASIPPAMLDGMLRVAVNLSFNRITVDGDTSTNDAVTLTATGQSDVVISPTTTDAAQVFQLALTTLATELAQDIVRDGEGATKFVASRSQAQQALRGGFGSADSRAFSLGEDSAFCLRPELGAHPRSHWTCRGRGPRR